MESAHEAKTGETNGSNKPVERIVDPIEPIAEAMEPEVAASSVPHDEHVEVVERYRYHKAGHYHYKTRYLRYKSHAARLMLAIAVLVCISIGAIAVAVSSGPY